ncbi:MAG: tRNA (N6-threonylcarbamoyladenosine(37)-N6)-methyltransferase TrmO [Nitrososphaerales archaeon]
MEPTNFTVKKIGVVRNEVKEPKYGGFTDLESRIELDGKYVEGLKDLGNYSHVTVVFWLNLVDSCDITHTPQGRQDVPEVGIFACRCPARPNPIAITTAELLGMEGRMLKVRGLDAVDGSPVLDIKPYTPQYDLREKVRVPDWVDKLAY